MNGGPSHVDTFDPKPLLDKYHGKPLPSPNLRTERKTAGALRSPFKFQHYGKSGIEVSELFARTAAEHIDDMCILRSMHADVPNHEPSLMLMNCGDGRLPRPSMGAWITYGLGSENQNLPGFIAMCPGGYPIVGPQNWRSAFLPGAYQGTYIDTQHTDIHKLIENIRNPDDCARRAAPPARPGAAPQRATSGRARPGRGRWRRASSPSSWPTACRPRPPTPSTSTASRWRCASSTARRRTAGSCSSRAGCWSAACAACRSGAAAGQPWDNHDNIAKEHRNLAGPWDQAIAAFLTDLKQRGLFDSTLVIWGGEFGRTPVAELPGLSGRDHNHYGFSMWLAGGGVKGGHVHGATDEFGFAAVENKVHVHDLHATILHLLGFDHEKLTYRYAGRDFRLTDVHGRVVNEILLN